MSWLDFLTWFRPSKPKPAPVTAVHFTSQVFPIQPFDAADVVARHNAERAKHVRTRLEHDANLDHFAAGRAAHAAQANLTIEHVHDGFRGIPGAGISEENAAMGQVDAESVLADWMSSPGHRANILSRASSMGAGRATSADSVTYWYCIFTG